MRKKDAKMDGYSTPMQLVRQRTTHLPPKAVILVRQVRHSCQRPFSRLQTNKPGYAADARRALKARAFVRVSGPITKAVEELAERHLALVGLHKYWRGKPFRVNHAVTCAL
jgi:hypothetical protein